MDTNQSNQEIGREILGILLGELLVTGLMFLVYVLLHKWTGKVLWGGLLGTALTLGNFIFMALSVTAASKKAVEGDVKGGSALNSSSMLIRYILLAAVLFIAGKTKIVDPIALVVPLLLFRPVLTVLELIRKGR